jgi:hypothetical protein
MTQIGQISEAHPSKSNVIFGSAMMDALRLSILLTNPIKNMSSSFDKLRTNGLYINR